MGLKLQTVDWLWIVSFLGLSVIIGAYSYLKSKESLSDFFLCDRKMPWWLLGFSMVATTFSTDTPNLVTNLVREQGIASNWVWWSSLLTGMLTVFLFTKLWTRLGVSTDIEFYELRYSGKSATFLRGFRAFYLGFFFNIMIMATVSLAAIKIGGTILGLKPVETLLYAMCVTGVISTLGGLRGVLITDFFLFILAMVGAFATAYFSLKHPMVGGLDGLMNKFSESPDVLAPKLDMVPSLDDWPVFLSVFLIPLAIQWWSVWYPGAEPGGGGYLVQRILAAKNKNHAIGATFFFNFAHFVFRPWPWIIVALCSLIVYPELSDIERAFPSIPKDKVGHDLAYPAMLSKLPPGWLGLALTSLIAAFISTISTHLNWGASYLVNDLYLRFYDEKPSDKRVLWVSRLATLLLMGLSMLVALSLKDAIESFNILLQIGAGTGLLFILRWFWWRINAISEIVAMVSSLIVAIVFLNIDGLSHSVKLVLGVAITTTCWVVATLLTRPTDEKVLRAFVEKTNPGGLGWKKVHQKAIENNNPIESEHPPTRFFVSFLYAGFSSVLIFGLLFCSGYLIYGEYSLLTKTFTTMVALLSILGYFIVKKGNPLFNPEIKD